MPGKALVETRHAAFNLHRPEIESMETTCGWDLAMIDEGPLLCAQQFEHLLRAHAAADHIPASVFFGDFQQLPPITGELRNVSPKWRSHAQAAQLKETIRSQCQS